MKYSSYGRIRSIFYWHVLTSIQAWISNYIHYIVWDKITNSFPNFNCATVEAWEWLSDFIPHFTGDVITYPYLRAERRQPDRDYKLIWSGLCWCVSYRLIARLRSDLRICSLWSAKQIFKNHVGLYSQLCVCAYPSTFRCQDIYRRSHYPV